MGTATVEIERRSGPLTADDFVTHPSGALIQVCRATVRAAGRAAERVTLFVVADGDAAATLDLAALARMSSGEPAGTIPALVRESAEGRARVDIGREHETRAPAVAQAAAVMRASWGWDESPEIVVTVNGTPIAVAPRFTGGAWTALVAGIAADAV